MISIISSVLLERRISFDAALQYFKRHFPWYVAHQGRYATVFRFDGLGDVVELVVPFLHSGITLKIGDYRFTTASRIPASLLPQQD